jgi:hypothetical protein
MSPALGPAPRSARFGGTPRNPHRRRPDAADRMHGCMGCDAHAGNRFPIRGLKSPAAATAARAGLLPPRRQPVDQVQDLPRRGRRRPPLHHRPVGVDQHQVEVPRPELLPERPRSAGWVSVSTTTRRSSSSSSRSSSIRICWRKRGSFALSAKTTTGRAVQRSSSSVGCSASISACSCTATTGVRHLVGKGGRGEGGSGKKAGDHYRWHGSPFIMQHSRWPLGCERHSGKLSDRAARPTGRGRDLQEVNP